MHWQDLVIAGGQIIFILALIPTITCEEKPHKKTCITTGAVLLVFVYTNYSLNLIFAAITSLILAVLWFFIGYQKHQLDSKNK